jgi:hypothetical protein
VAVAIAWGVWDVAPIAIAASVIEGLGISIDILSIVFGALLLLATLSASGGAAGGGPRPWDGPLMRGDPVGRRGGQQHGT